MKIPEGSGNPYASLAQNIDVEEELERLDRLVRRKSTWCRIQSVSAVQLDFQVALETVGNAKTASSCNPYAILSADTDEEEALVTPNTQNPARPVEPPKIVSKVEFRSRARAVLLQYEPLRGDKRTLRPEFREFILKNEGKSAISRAEILAELSRYDLATMGSLNPHLNREGDEITRKLESISKRFPF